MSGLGVDEPAVRSSISRLKRRGILEAERVDGVAGYALSEHAREILAEGDRRIFERPRGRRAGRLGDGRLQRPGDRAAEAAHPALPAVLARFRHGGGRRVDRARSPRGRDPRRARAVRPGPLREALPRRLPRLRRASGTQVRAWWDIEGLEKLYEEFATAQAPVLARWRRRRVERRRDGVRRLRAVADACGGGCRSSTPAWPPELLPTALAGRPRGGPLPRPAGDVSPSRRTATSRR